MDSKSYEIRWSFTSKLNEVDIERYFTRYKGEIVETCEELGADKLIGKVSVDLIHTVLIENNEEFAVELVMDVIPEIEETVSDILILGELELNENIQEYYEHVFNYADICIIQRVELIASHRSKGIGKLIIKDIYSRFHTCSQIFVVKSFPLQFETGFKAKKENEKTEWDKLLDLKSLESDHEKAFYQLKAFYQKIGFDHIDGYDELMFLNPALKNELINSIRLDL